MKIAVVGAGISGLTCAYELKKAGCDVDVFEKGHIGGRMATRVKKGFHFDIGADHLCNLYTEMKKYCREFNIPWEKMRFLSYHVVKNGEIVPTHKAMGLLSKLRLGLQYLRTRKMDLFNLSNNYEHDVNNGYDFMNKVVGREIADYFVDAASATYQFHRAKAISQAAVLGMISSLKRDKEKWHLHRTKGGMSALPDAFAKRVGVTKKTISKVVGGKTVSVNGKKYDAVVLATPANVTKTIYKNPTAEQKTVLEEAKYAASISVAFTVPEKTLERNAIIWVPYVESKKLSGIVNEEMKGKDLVVKGRTLVCTWLHQDFAKKIMNKTDKEIFSLVKKELVRLVPSLTNLENHDLQRWPQAMPIFSHGYITTVRNFVNYSQGENNVYFCGDYLNSLWIEGSIRGGQRVAKSLLSDLSK